MKIYRLFLILFCFIFSFSHAKDLSVLSIVTNNAGELSKCTNFLLFDSCSRVKVSVPKELNAGDRIYLYNLENKGEAPIQFSFRYIDYVPERKLCRLRPKGDVGEDIVYIHDCIVRY